jgi:hypothetical protein
VSSSGFVSEFRYARIRARATTLVLPMLLLAGESAALTVIGPRLPSDASAAWLTTLFYAVAAALALAFWFFPVVKYLATWLEITNANVFVRDRLLGAARKVALSKILDVRVESKSTLILVTVDQGEIEFARLAKAKTVAAELKKLLG